MSSEVVTKTIWQFSKKLDAETMDFLRGIASDYSKVKNYAYNRYSGIKSIDKLVPGYEILNEMRAGGMRQQLDLPVVYFEMALFEAVWDIKAMWQNLKNKITLLANQNENLSDDDKSYIRLVMRINSVYSAILNDRQYDMPQKAAKLNIDVKKLNNRIKRWTRKYKVSPVSEASNTFRVTPGGYSYKNGGIRLVSRVDRKRVFIPLRDATPFKRQLNIIVMDDYIKIAVPIDKDIDFHHDYCTTIYAHIGYKDMITLSNGAVYGADLNTLVLPETERLADKNRVRHKTYSVYSQCIENGDIKKAERIQLNNLGKVKYDKQKHKKRAETVTFINTALNKMLESEKPSKIVITAPIKHFNMNKYSKQTKKMFTRSFSGVIRERLKDKCIANGIELIEINSRDTGAICSSCGEKGIRKNLVFHCEKCNLEIPSALNSAKNIEKKYQKQ